MKHKGKHLQVDRLQLTCKSRLAGTQASKTKMPGWGDYRGMDSTSPRARLLETQGGSYGGNSGGRMGY